MRTADSWVDSRAVMRGAWWVAKRVAAKADSRAESTVLSLVALKGLHSVVSMVVHSVVQMVWSKAARKAGDWAEQMAVQ